jgi:hypothetical protein
VGQAEDEESARPARLDAVVQHAAAERLPAGRLQFLVLPEQRELPTRRAARLVSEPRRALDAPEQSWRKPASVWEAAVRQRLLLPPLARVLGAARPVVRQLRMQRREPWEQPSTGPQA